jgi:hypothetical protein
VLGAVLGLFGADPGLRPAAVVHAVLGVPHHRRAVLDPGITVGRVDEDLGGQLPARGFQFGVEVLRELHDHANTQVEPVGKGAGPLSGLVQGLHRGAVAALPVVPAHRAGTPRAVIAAHHARPMPGPP